MNLRSCAYTLVASLSLLPGLAQADAPQLAPLRYEVINLGSLGGGASSALALNDMGLVVGWSTTASGQRHAFLYDDGQMSDLGTLIGGTTSTAVAISDQGVIVGTSGINGAGPGFPEIDQGFVWQNGQMTSAGALYCPCSFNVRYGTSGMGGINDSGYAVGWSGTVRGTNVLHASLWKDGSLQDLGGGEGDWSISRIFAINDNGLMVGDYALNAGQLGADTFDRQASLWQSDGMRTSLGTLPGYTTSSALAINRRGEVVGWSGSPDGLVSHAFLWRNGTMHALAEPSGYANSMALAINALGSVVGWSSSADGSLYHAVIWQRGQATDLNDALPSDSGWVLNQAAGINILGQIAGTGVFNGQTSAYLLSPIFLSDLTLKFVGGPTAIPVQGH